MPRPRRMRASIRPNTGGLGSWVFSPRSPRDNERLNPPPRPGPLGIHGPHALPDRHPPPPHRRLQRLAVGHPEEARAPREGLLVGHGEPTPLHLALEDLPAQLAADGLFLVPDPLLDLVARAAGPHVGEPVAARPGLGRGE